MSWTPQVIKWKPDNLRGEVKKNVTEYVYAPDVSPYAIFNGLGNTGTVSNGSRTVAAGNARGGAASQWTASVNNGGVSTLLVPFVAEFTIDVLGVAGAMYVGNGQIEYLRSDGSRGGSAWAAGDKIGMLRYDTADGVTKGNAAYFQNGTLVHDARFNSSGFTQYQLYADASTGQITLQADISLMTYAATYKAFRHAGLTMPDASSWPA